MYYVTQSCLSCDFVCLQWKANLASMSRVAAGQSLSVNQLVDMEWRFGGTIPSFSHTQYLPPSLSGSLSLCLSIMLSHLPVTAADSDMDKVGNSFLQLKMVLNKGSGTDKVFMGKFLTLNFFHNLWFCFFSYVELTLPQFYSFLHEMEKAKACLEYLS